MKCVQCGAILKEEHLVCPYCGAINEEASVRKKEVDTIENKNKALKKEVLEKSKEEIHTKIHRRVNFVLTCVFILLVFISFGTYMIVEENLFGPKGTEEEMIRYYEAGDFENLYLCMNSGELFDPELRYEYSHMALLWNKYQSCQIYFAKAYQEYDKTGVYDGYYLERCIEYGCEVLTGEFSYTYDVFPEINKEKAAWYQEQVMILFTGVLQIPDELITEMYNEEYYYNRADILTEYVLEVLPNEY